MRRTTTLLLTPLLHTKILQPVDVATGGALNRRDAGSIAKGFYAKLDSFSCLFGLRCF